MGKTVQLTCDGCGADIAYTGNSVDYRLALVVQSMPSRGGFVTDMMIYPPLKHDCYFCGLNCMDQWTDRRRHHAALWKKNWDERTTKGEGMSVVAGLSEEARERLDEEFSAAALAAFPLGRRKRL